MSLLGGLRAVLPLPLLRALDEWLQRLACCYGGLAERLGWGPWADPVVLLRWLAGIEPWPSDHADCTQLAEAARGLAQQRARRRLLVRFGADQWSGVWPLLAWGAPHLTLAEARAAAATAGLPALARRLDPSDDAHLSADSPLRGVVVQVLLEAFERRVRELHAVHRRHALAAPGFDHASSAVVPLLTAPLEAALTDRLWRACMAMLECATCRRVFVPPMEGALTRPTVPSPSRALLLLALDPPEDLDPAALLRHPNATADVWWQLLSSTGRNLYRRGSRTALQALVSHPIGTVDPALAVRQAYGLDPLFAIALLADESLACARSLLRAEPGVADYVEEACCSADPDTRAGAFVLVGALSKHLGISAAGP